MNIYLTIMVTVLVLTQIVRIVQNTMGILNENLIPFVVDSIKKERR